jgi:hypothetical protein
MTSLRLRWLLVLLGAIVLAATYTYPLWRPEPRINVEQAGFPGLPAELQERFLELPPEQQQAYLQMNRQNSLQALELLAAHLSPPGPLPEEETALPPVENAVIAESGEFVPLEIPADDEEERQLPPFYEILYADAAGSFTIYQFPDNTRLLRLEGLDVVNGPDLHVALSPNPIPLSGEISELGNIFIDIGPLKSNTGDQNYTSVPDANNVNLNNYSSVVIYDQTHRIIFAVAPFE